MVKKKSSKRKKAKVKDHPESDSVSAAAINEKSLEMTDEREIALDFSTKVYEKFSKMVKSIILFGSTLKDTSKPTSDIDIIIIVDDASIVWDEELIAWYREELGKIMSANKYVKRLHVNTTKLTAWWQDMLRGDPVVINILRYGEAIIDFGGFFNPLKILLQQGKIKSTPEAIFTLIQRAPAHLSRSKAAEISAVEGIYWAFVDAAHASLIAAKIMPPSPEQVGIMLNDAFVKNKLLNSRYVIWYKDIYHLHRGIMHGEVKDIKGEDIDIWQKRADEFIGVMASLVNKIVGLEDNNRQQ
jgi:predicted nucleotidyltransferase/uncharacterized protein (UPF0332 family)